jgi:hypothetical protein
MARRNMLLCAEYSSLYATIDSTRLKRSTSSRQHCQYLTTEEFWPEDMVTTNLQYNTRVIESELRTSLSQSGTSLEQASQWRLSRQHTRHICALIQQATSTRPRLP